MLVAIALIPPPPLRLELRLPARVDAGQTVEARAIVRNASTRPIVLVEAILPNVRLGMRIERTIEGPNGRVVPDERGPMTGQWFSGHTVPASAFFVLRAVESREIYAESFAVRFLGERPSLIADVRDAPRAPLSPGEYRYRLAYRLTPRVPTRTRRFGEEETETPEAFERGARRLFDACWGGRVETEATFSVIARPGRPAPGTPPAPRR